MPEDSISDSIEEASQALAELKQLVESARQEKANIESTFESAKKAIADFVSKSNTSFAEIDASKTAAATAKGAIDEIQRTATADASVITNTKQELEKIRSVAAATANSLHSEHSEIDAKIETLKERETALADIVNEIVSVHDNATELRDGTAEAVKSIADEKKRFDELSAQAESAHNDLTKKHANVDAQIADINKANDAVKEIFNGLFVDSPQKTSIKTAISDLHTKIGDSLEKTEKQRQTEADEFKAFTDAALAERENLVSTAKATFSKLQETLKEQILSLLPSAGAAGLASTYYDAKSKYAFTPFHPDRDDPLASKSQVRKYFGHDPTSWFATIFFYAMFLGPMITIVWLFFDLLHQLAIKPRGTFSTEYLFFRTLIAVPLGTISLFGYSSLRLYRRLFEEYNYKQRVMELYLSFSKEIEAKGNDDQKEALLAIMLKAVADKPTLSMHKYDGIASDGGLKLDLGPIFSRLFSPKQ